MNTTCWFDSPSMILIKSDLYFSLIYWSIKSTISFWVSCFLSDPYLKIWLFCFLWKHTPSSVWKLNYDSLTQSVTQRDFHRWQPHVDAWLFILIINREYPADIIFDNSANKSEYTVLLMLSCKGVGLSLASVGT